MGKGVGDRTFFNMLSSQAMCFNLFAPLAEDLELAAEVLRPFIPDLARVRQIRIEYTPPNEVFGDQTGRGGVDCDVLLDVELARDRGCVVIIETKFVEPEFSGCGFRAAGREKKRLPSCPTDIDLDGGGERCMYSSRKSYRYWEQTLRLRTLGLGAVPSAGCPFGGAEWQLWVNHTLAHVEAERRGFSAALFLVCAPTQNEALFRDQAVTTFKARIAQPNTAVLLPLDDLLQTLARVHEGGARAWGDALLARYGNI